MLKVEKIASFWEILMIILELKSVTRLLTLLHVLYERSCVFLSNDEFPVNVANLPSDGCGHVKRVPLYFNLRIPRYSGIRINIVDSLCFEKPAVFTCL